MVSDANYKRHLKNAHANSLPTTSKPEPDHVQIRSPSPDLELRPSRILRSLNSSSLKQKSVTTTDGNSLPKTSKPNLNVRSHSPSPDVPDSRSGYSAVTSGGSISAASPSKPDHHHVRIDSPSPDLELRPPSRILRSRNGSLGEKEFFPQSIPPKRQRSQDEDVSASAAGNNILKIVM